MLDGMPPGMLAAITFSSLGMAFVFRGGLAMPLIENRALILQPRYQFFLDYGLILGAGLVSVLINTFTHGVPLGNGLLFFIGFVSFGFFIAIDMSLQRERSVIFTAMSQSPKIPSRFYPLTRKFFFVAFATNVLMMIIIMLIIGRDLVWLAGMDLSQMNLMIEMTTQTIFKELLFIITVLLIMVTNILYSYSKNLKLLFQTETGVLESVTSGDLSRLVPVATSDEFGMIAGYTNKMIQGLRDRIRILTHLKVAREVQENLLPSRPPAFKNLDISGSSLYCEEVGGDYFDYFPFSKDRLGIVLADSSGHGVGAGLDMTTIRAFLRYGAENYSGPAQLINAVNRHLTRDSSETGRFTTLFFADIDMESKCLKWVRAGHEPALFFRPGTGEIEKLRGSGMALGVEEDTPIQENELRNWEPGSVLVILSDGIKESRNGQGEMYGEDRIIQTLLQHASQPAKAIESKLIEDLEKFRGNVPISDDITIVIVKFL